MPGTLSRKAARKMKNKAELQGMEALANIFSHDADSKAHVPNLHAKRPRVPFNQGHYSEKGDNVQIEHHEIANASNSHDVSEAPIQTSSESADSQASPSVDQRCPFAVENPTSANNPPMTAESNVATVQASTTGCPGRNTTLPKGVVTFPQALLMTEQYPLELRILPIAHHVLSYRGAAQEAEQKSTHSRPPDSRSFGSHANIPSTNGLHRDGSDGAHTNHHSTANRNIGEESNQGDGGGKISGNVPRDQGLPKDTDSRRSNNGEDSPNGSEDDGPPIIPDTQANLGYDLTLFEYDWKYPADGLYVSAKLKCLRSVPEGQGEMVMMAVTFVFHLGSNTTSRVSRASIKILPYRIQGGKTINFRKIPYFSPRAVFGKFSKESLMWQFVPVASRSGASLGSLNMNRAPAPSATLPHRSMMIIQGSVRSFEGLEQSSLLWTIEEDHEGCSGIPGEFTFSFAVLQEVARDPFRLHIQIIPTVIYLASEDIPSTNLQYRRQFCHAEAQYSSTLNGFQFGGETLPSSDTVEEQLNTMVEFPGAPWSTPMY